jgi:hypothetical protein
VPKISVLENGNSFSVKEAGDDIFFSEPRHVAGKHGKRENPRQETGSYSSRCQTVRFPYVTRFT